MVDQHELFERAFDVESFLTREQGKVLFELAKEATNNIGELGSWKGRSSIILAAGMLSGKDRKQIFCVDTWKNCDLQPYKDYFPQWKEAITRNGLKDVCVPIQSDSVQAARQFEPNSFGLLFIDTWHTRIAIENDLRAWWSRIIPGGKIVFHDVEPSWPEILEFVDWLEKEEQKAFGIVERIERMAILTKPLEK